MEWLNTEDLLSILELDKLGEELRESKSNLLPVWWPGGKCWDQNVSPGCPEWRTNTISSKGLPDEVSSQVGKGSSEFIPVREHAVDVGESIIPSTLLILLDQEHGHVLPGVEKSEEIEGS